MGSKFCNLNVRGVSHATLAAVKPEFCGYECATGWLTVTSPLFQWGSTQEYAKELSLSLPAPVLSTEYFDDDYVEFALYDSGKLVTKHVPVSYEDLTKRRGNAAMFLNTLGLNVMDEALLKKVFSVTDCEQSVCLVESLFGCPILGVREYTPPDEAPSRSIVDAFAGGEQEKVLVITKKNSTPKNKKPYLFNDEGDRRDKSSMNCGTVFCYSDATQDVVARLEKWLEKVSSYKELQNQLRRLKIQVILCGDIVVIKGFPFVSPSIDAIELSKMFRCLVGHCHVSAYHYNGREIRRLDCALAYAKRLICSGTRGDEWCNKVMQDIELKSPWLALSYGVLLEAFEKSAFWDSVNAVGDLLGFPLYPASDAALRLIRERNHLRVYECLK